MVVSNRLLIVAFNTNMIMRSIIHVVPSASAVVGAVCEVA